MRAIEGENNDNPSEDGGLRRRSAPVLGEERSRKKDFSIDGLLPQPLGQARRNVLGNKVGAQRVW